MRRPSEFFNVEPFHGALIFNDDNVPRVHVKQLLDKRDTVGLSMSLESAKALHDLLHKMLSQLKRESRRAGAKTAQPSARTGAK